MLRTKMRGVKIFNTISLFYIFVINIISPFFIIIVNVVFFITICSVMIIIVMILNINIIYSEAVSLGLVSLLLLHEVIGIRTYFHSVEAKIVAAIRHSSLPHRQSASLSQTTLF